mmetsp:Transcript_13444/g.37134  ORF Transcript_13444/g.37134 Transcript_13444/m.37134 type:complete len:205 (-) Transcript_13444:393-1007(-)
MDLCLENGQTIQVWANSSHQHVIAIVQQVMTRYRRLDAVWCFIHDVVHCLFCTDVLHCHLQCGKCVDQGLDNFFNKQWLSIKNVNFRIGHLRMNTEHHVTVLKSLQRWVTLLNIRYSKLRVGSGTSWIILDAHNPGLLCLVDFFGRGVVGQIQDHDRFKLFTIAVGRHGLLNVRLVFESLFRGGEGRHEIRHEETPMELFGGMF